MEDGFFPAHEETTKGTAVCHIPCAPPGKTSNAPFHVPSGRPSPRGGTIFANAARDAGTELVANNSQFQNRPEAPSFRNLQHRPADRIFNWAQGGAVHLQALSRNGRRRLGDMNDRIQSRDIPRVYQPFSV